MAQSLTCDGCGYSSLFEDEFRFAGIGPAVLYKPMIRLSDSMMEAKDFCSQVCALKFVREQLEKAGLPQDSRNPQRQETHHG